MVESDLHHAVHESNQEIIERLLKEGMSPNERCQHKITPLQIAVQNNDEKSVDLLIKFGADVNTHVTVIDEDEAEIDMTPLAIASCLNFGKIVQKLLSANADINENVHERQNALTFALASDANECTKILLDCGASVNNKDAKENTPIMIAARYGNPEIITLLLEKGAEINWSNKFGQTALVFVAQRGNVECLSVCDDDGNNALMNLTDQWDKDASEVLILLIRAGCDVNCINKDGDYPLMTALETDVRHSVLQELIQNGAVINGASGDDYTPLAHIAGSSIDTDNECSQICEILLNAGADPNKGTPVVKAASEGMDCLVQMLLNYGSDINSVDEMYGTVLLMGGWKENHNIVKIALQYNAKINLGQDKVVSLYNYISWPEKINRNKAIMLMAAAGELFPFEEYADVELPTIFVEIRDDLGLKNLCRKAIRKSVVENATHENMFDAGRIVGLPPILQDYLVFGMSMSDESDQWEEPNESDESNKSDE